MVKPSIDHSPRAKASRGNEAIEVAESCGLKLDDWQKYVLRQGCKVRANGKWAAFEVGVDVARQNGKGGILEGLELGGIFAFDDRYIIHSAHLVDTSLEAMERLLDLLEAGNLDREIKRVVRTNGREAILFRSGQRIRFRTRTKGGGRGFTADKVLLDEAMYIPEVSVGAMLPTLSARPNPQVWYTGSAVDQLIHEHGNVFARVRRRGLAKQKRLCYIEYSAPGTIDNLEPVIDDRAAWKASNPALGIRISEQHIEDERRAMDSRTFAVERLGIGDWPVEMEDANAIDFDDWRKLIDVRSFMLDPICLAFDVVPSRERSVIAAAGLRSDGLYHVEVVDQRRGTGWLPERIAELTAGHGVASVSCDPASPAAALVRPLENLDVEVEQLSARDYAAACGTLYDLVEQQGFRHLGTDDLSIAVKNASTRPLGEAWAWSRKLSAADISPLCAATIALWQATARLGSVYDERGLLAV